MNVVVRKFPDARFSLAHISTDDVHLREELWRAAALDFLEACFVGCPSETVVELANVFRQANYEYRK